jgi:hypothetical protein
VIMDTRTSNMDELPPVLWYSFPHFLFVLWDVTKCFEKPISSVFLQYISIKLVMSLSVINRN